MSAVVARSQKSTIVRSERQVDAVRFGLRLTSQVSTRLAAQWAEHLFTTPRRHTRPAREEAILATGERLTIRGGPELLAAWQWGSGPAVLLVHGWEGRGSQLGAFVAPLVARGHRVIAFDGPAHGDSTGRHLTVAGLADAVRAAGAIAGEIHGVVAHSFGAPAVTVALSRGLAVGRVAFVGPAAAAEGATQRFARYLAITPEVRAAMEKNLEERNGMALAQVRVPDL